MKNEPIIYTITEKGKKADPLDQKFYPEERKILELLMIKPHSINELTDEVNEDLGICRTWYLIKKCLDTLEKIKLVEVRK